MNALAGDNPQLASRRGGFKGLAWLGGVLATVAAAVIGATLAVVFAGAVLVISLMGAALLAMAGLAMRARRTVHARRRPADPDVIEARHVGGHSWVAYGWDQRRS